MKVVTCGSKFLVKQGEEVKVVEVPRPVKEKRDTEEKEKEEQESSGRISCSAVSSTGDLLAVCDDLKQVSQAGGGWPFECTTPDTFLSKV